MVWAGDFPAVYIPPHTAVDQFIEHSMSHHMGRLSSENDPTISRVHFLQSES